MKTLLVYFVCLMAFISYSENGYGQTGLDYYVQGLEYHNAKDYNNAARCFAYSADRAYPGGIFYLGYYFYRGISFTQDYDKAFTLFKEAAERGNEQAQCFLGLCYEHGRGVTKDMTKAVALYRAAADVDYTLAI